MIRLLKQKLADHLHSNMLTAVRYDRDMKLREIVVLKYYIKQREKSRDFWYKIAVFFMLCCVGLLICLARQ